MFKMLIDTSVWLDLAKDPRQLPILRVVEEMTRLRMLAIIVPRVVLDEFRTNRQRVAQESARSLSTHFRLVKDAIGRAGGDKRRMRVVLSHLDDVDHKIPLVGGVASQALDRIEALLKGTPTIEASETVKLRAAQRAIDKRAPFHHGKNAMADALIAEIYGQCVQEKASAGVRFAFVTHNKKDFSSESGSQKMPHEDLSNLFSRVKSLYFISLPEALRRVDPSLVSDVMLEETWAEEPRGLSEILEAEELLFHQVWYNRHWNLRIRIKEGKIKVVEQETHPHAPGAPETIQRDVLQAAMRAALRVERRFGKKNLGPWDDFEWGMVNGKLSALRWVLGDEWDMLDT